MKKYIAGFIAGIVFSISATVFADDIQSLVGKKVQAEYTVEVNGQTLNTVVVEGKNYAPVRSIGEAAGYTVNVEGQKVVFKEGAKMDTATVKEKYRLDKITSLKTAISITEKELADNKILLEQKREMSTKFTSESDKEIYSRLISDIEKKITQLAETLDQQISNLAQLQVQ